MRNRPRTAVGNNGEYPEAYLRAFQTHPLLTLPPPSCSSRNPSSTLSVLPSLLPGALQLQLIVGPALEGRAEVLAARAERAQRGKGTAVEVDAAAVTVPLALGQRISSEFNKPVLCRRERDAKVCRIPVMPSLLVSCPPLPSPCLPSLYRLLFSPDGT
eukprot:747612-Hanusia_phi.AAC.2